LPAGASSGDELQCASFHVKPCLAHTQFGLQGFGPSRINPWPQATAFQDEHRFNDVHRLQRAREHLRGWPGKGPILPGRSFRPPPLVANSGNEQMVRNEW
jgi:hypothetical protein